MDAAIETKLNSSSARFSNLDFRCLSVKIYNVVAGYKEKLLCWIKLLQILQILHLNSLLNSKFFTKIEIHAVFFMALLWTFN